MNINNNNNNSESKRQIKNIECSLSNYEKTTNEEITKLKKEELPAVI